MSYLYCLFCYNYKNFFKKLFEICKEMKFEMKTLSAVLKHKKNLLNCERSSFFPSAADNQKKKSL